MDRTERPSARVRRRRSARLHDAQNAQIAALNGQSLMRHTISELQAQAEVATLEQQLAQQQLDILQQQLKSATRRPADDPKDEQNARISEREKYLGVVDAGYQLRRPRSTCCARPASCCPGSNPLPRPPHPNTPADPSPQP